MWVTHTRTHTHAHAHTHTHTRAHTHTHTHTHAHTLSHTHTHTHTQPVEGADFIVPVEIDGVIHQVYVLKRPYCDQFLERMGELFECVLFTASLSKVRGELASSSAQLVEGTDCQEGQTVCG